MGQEGISGALGDPFKGKESVGDFFAPFYRVRFLTPSPNQIVKYGADGEELGGGLPAASQEGMEVASSDGATEVKFDDGNVAFLRSFSTSLEVVDEGGGASTATLHLEPTYEDYLYIVDNKLIQFGGVMVIEYGWLGQGGDYFGASDVISSDPHYYVIQTPTLSINNLDISIDIVGSDIFGYAATQRTSSRTWDRNDSRYNTDLGILEELARPMGMTIDTSLTNGPPPGVGGGGGIGDSPFAAATSPAGNVTGIHAVRPLEGEPEIVEQTELDWVFFNDILTSNNCTFFTVGTTIFVADKNVVKTRQPSYNLLLFQQMKTDKDVPITSFSANALDQLFQPATARETCANSANPDTNEVGANITDPATSDFFTYLGLKTVAGKDSAPGATVSLSDKESATPDPKFADDQTGKVWSVPYAMTNKEELTRQPAREGVLVGADSANVTTPGLPSVTPAMLVKVNGAGKAFDGPYFVIKATHRIDPGGYETVLDLSRDTSTADLEVGPQASTQPPSTNNPETDTSGLEGVTASGDQVA